MKCLDSQHCNRKSHTRAKKNVLNQPRVKKHLNWSILSKRAGGMQDHSVLQIYRLSLLINKILYIKYYFLSRNIILKTLAVSIKVKQINL